MPFNDTYSNDILNFMFGKKSLEAPTTVYIGLCSNDPVADGGTFTELSGGGYSRVAVVKMVNGADALTLINSAANREIKNGKQINWNKATADWNPAKGYGLFTEETGGTPFFYDAIELTEEQQEAGGLIVVSGAVALIDPETLKISLPITATAEATAE